MNNTRQDLIAINDFSNQLQELEQIQNTCRQLMQTRHYANIGEVGIHAILARSKALGVHPFEALNGGFYCVNGRVGMSTEMMAALVRRRGHSISKDPRSTNECVILNGKRADNGDEWTCSFSKEDAIQAGLWHTAIWKKYPAIMLYNRCMSMLFRQLFPDLSLGAGYVQDELEEITKTGNYKNLKDEDVEVIDTKKKLKESPSQLEPKEEEIITDEQFEILSRKLDASEEEFRMKTFEALKRMGYSNLRNIPDSLYQRICNAAECKSLIKNATQETSRELVNEIR